MFLIVFCDEIIDAYGRVAVRHVKSTAWTERNDGQGEQLNLLRHHTSLSTAWIKLQLLRSTCCFLVLISSFFFFFFVSGQLEKDLYLRVHLSFSSFPYYPHQTRAIPNVLHISWKRKKKQVTLDSIKQKGMNRTKQSCFLNDTSCGLAKNWSSVLNQI